MSKEAPNLKACPFCESPAGLSPTNQGRDYATETRSTGMALSCVNSKCHASMYRARCFTDNSHTAQETNEALVADLVYRWNSRPTHSPVNTAQPAGSELRRTLASAKWFMEFYGKPQRHKFGESGGFQETCADYHRTLEEIEAASPSL